MDQWICILTVPCCQAAFLYNHKDAGSSKTYCQNHLPKSNENTPPLYQPLKKNQDKRHPNTLVSTCFVCPQFLVRIFLGGRTGVRVGLGGSVTTGCRGLQCRGLDPKWDAVGSASQDDALIVWLVGLWQVNFPQKKCGWKKWGMFLNEKLWDIWFWRQFQVVDWFYHQMCSRISKHVCLFESLFTVPSSLSTIASWDRDNTYTQKKSNNNPRLL